MEKDRRLIIFLPWIRFEKPIRVCGINFIPLELALKSDETGIALIRQIDAIIEQYRLDPYNSEKDAVVCSALDDPFSIDNEDHFSEIQDATKVLAICCISENKYFRSSTRYINSSCFELVGQRFVVGDYHSAFMSRRRDGSTTDAGYSYNSILTNAPAYIRQCKDMKINDALVNAIEKLKAANSTEYNRILLSFEWFLASFTDSPSASHSFEAVALAAAFDQSHQSNMSPGLLHKVLSMGKLKQEEHWQNDIRCNWYKQFKDKRNAMIHGSVKRTIDKQDLFLDLFIGTQLLYSLWKHLLALCSFYQLTEDDINARYSLEMLIESRDHKNWNNRIEIARRRALKEIKETENK